MANWTMGDLKIVGPEKKVKKFIKDLKSKEGNAHQFQLPHSDQNNFIYVESNKSDLNQLESALSDKSNKLVKLFLPNLSTKHSPDRLYLNNLCKTYELSSLEATFLEEDNCFFIHLKIEKEIVDTLRDEYVCTDIENITYKDNDDEDEPSIGYKKLNKAYESMIKGSNNT